MARFWHPKGTRAVGDQGVPRQTVLLTKATPSANFSIDFAPAQDQHPNWSGEEAYIYFDSDRVSDTGQHGAPGWRVQHLPHGSRRLHRDSDHDRQRSDARTQHLHASNRLAYVKGGQVLNQNIGQPTEPFQRRMASTCTFWTSTVRTAPPANQRRCQRTIQLCRCAPPVLCAGRRPHMLCGQAGE